MRKLLLKSSFVLLSVLQSVMAQQERQQQPQQPQQQQQQQPPQQPQTMRKIYGLLTILIVIIAYLTWWIIQKPPKIYCPNDEETIYIPTTAKHYQIDATINNPSNAEYLWELNPKHKKYDTIASIESLGILVSRWIKGVLPITNVEQAGYVEYKLTISVFNSEKTCKVPIQFYEASIIGIDLGTTYSCVSYQTREATTLNSGKVVHQSHVVLLDQRVCHFCVVLSEFVCFATAFCVGCV